jgi:LPXTG-site transpeptidase (sortase) family protein
MQPTIFDRVFAAKVPFLIAFFIIFTISYGILFALDWLPEPVTTAPTTEDMVNKDAATTTSSKDDTTESETPAESAAAEQPISLSLPTLDRTVAVLNPDSRDIAVLDAALLKGVVRHPDSALLGESGNVVILGHSSYLPNVTNKNFQALNGIQKMKWGDTITLSGDGTLYTYRVEKVYEAKASGVTIPTDVTGKRLTLVTCNSFGSTEDRFIVEATLISGKAL